MREFKLRCWNTTTGEMQEIESIDFNHGKVEQVNTDNDRILFPDKECVLMHYTGLKDRHGIEIYEGDVVTWHNKYFEYNNPPREFKGQIKYDTGHFAIFTFDGTWDNADWVGAITDIEVIGNIYENPELLKEK